MTAPRPVLEAPMIDARYVNRSVCPCGFPALGEQVPLNKIYRISTIGGDGQFRCGGCGTWRKIPCVWAADDSSGGALMVLPLHIFDLNEVVEKAREANAA